MSTSNQLAVLVIGNWRSPDFRPALAGIPADALSEVPDIPAAFQLLAQTDSYPDLIVVCQHWPDEYPQGEVQRLPALAPLARLLCIYGPWCEADGRNRSSWPAATRCPHSLAPLRVKQLIQAHQAGRSPLPMTASRDESWLEQFATPPLDAEPLASSPSQVHVHAADRRWRESISQALNDAGIPTTDSATLTQPPDSNVTVLIFDADPWSEIRNRPDDLRRCFPKAALLAMLSLPEADLTADDAVRVLPKLIPVRDLIEIVAQTASRP